jgi:hypothetical protein
MLRLFWSPFVIWLMLWLLFLVTEQWSGYCLASPTTLLLTLCRNAQ